MNADIGSKDKEKEATSLIMRGMKRGIEILESAKNTKDEIIKKSGEYIFRGKQISKELYNKFLGYYDQVKKCIGLLLTNITDMTPFASVETVTKLFNDTFSNTKIILKHFKTFFVLFVTILILNINTIIEIVKLYANTAADFIANFGVTAESTNEQDPYFKIFGDYWIQVVKEIYLFLNPTARDDFKKAIVDVVFKMTEGNCNTINPDNQNPMQLFIDNARLGVNLGAYYFFKYSSKSAAPVMGGGENDPPAKDPPADPLAKDPPAKDPLAKDPPAKDPLAKDPPAKDPPAVAPSAPPSQDNPSTSSDPATDTAPPTTEEINALGEPTKNMQKLIENNILLYMLLTGHTKSDTICKHFVGYVNNNLETKLNADAERFDDIYSDKAESKIQELPSDPITIQQPPPIPSRNGKQLLTKKEQQTSRRLLENKKRQRTNNGGKRKTKTKTKTKRRTKKRKTKRR